VIVVNLIDVIKDEGKDLDTRISAVRKLDELTFDLDDVDEDMQLFIVRNSQNQSLLADFVLKSQFMYVHYHAMQRIGDEDILCRIALNDRHTYSPSLEAIPTCVYVSYPFYNREKAFSKIRDKSKLAEIVKRIDVELNNVGHIVNFINCDDEWLDIFANANLEFYRLFAVGQISDGETLKKIIVDTEDAEIRMRAIENIDDEKILLELKDCDNGDVRRLACENIAQPSSIADSIENYTFLFDKKVFEDVSDEDVLKAADLDGADEDGFVDVDISKIDDDNVLYGICRGRQSWDLVNALLVKISDENVLGDLLCDKSISLHEWRYVEHALDKIQDEKILEKIYFHNLGEENYYRHTKEFRRYAVARINDEDFLKQVVLKEEDEDISSNAISKIDDEEFFKKVALESGHYDAVEYAVSKIGDEDFLQDLLLNDGDYRFNDLIINRLDDEEFFKGIFSNPELEWLRPDVVCRIDDQEFLGNLLDSVEAEYLREREKFRNGITGYPFYTLYWRKIILQIDDEEILKMAFLKDDDEDFRLDLLKKISDDKFLFDVAIGDYQYHVKLNSFYKLRHDESNVIRIAHNFQDCTMSEIAISSLSDETALGELAEMEPTSQCEEKLIKEARERIYSLFFHPDVKMSFY
jgi:hypothetical protein